MADTSTLTENQVKLQEQANVLTTEVLDSLVSGKSPLSSKTILTNIGLFGAGLIGVLYELYIGGDVSAMAPFLVSMGASCVNTILRFVTTGPIMSNAMQKMLGTLVSLPPPTQ